MRYRVMLLGLAVPALLIAQQPEQSTAAVPRRRQPRARRCLRLEGRRRRLDLTADDFTVYEDDKPQTSREFRADPRARRRCPTSERRDVNNTRDMRQQAADAARVFTLFFDPLYIELSGAYHLQKPLIETLDKVIGPDDMVGAMTPDMSPSAITYGRRSTASSSSSASIGCGDARRDGR